MDAGNRVIEKMKVKVSKAYEVARPAGRLGLTAVIALLSPLFVVDYLTTPEPWHDFFGTPWFASAMSGVASMSALIVSGACWLGLAPKAVPNPESAQENVARLLRQGDLLEVRSAHIVDGDDEGNFGHLPFFPLPVIGDGKVPIKADIPFIDVLSTSTESTITELFAFFDAHPDAFAALGLSSCATSGRTMSFLVTRSDRIPTTLRHEADHKLRGDLMRAHKQSQSGDSEIEAQRRLKTGRIMRIERWRELIAPFEKDLTESRKQPAAPFAPLPWTQEDQRVYEKLPLLAHLHRPARIFLSSTQTTLDAIRDAYENASDRLTAARRPSRLMYHARAAAGWGSTVIDALVAHKDRMPPFEGDVHDVTALTELRGKDIGLTQMMASLPFGDTSDVTAIVHRVNETRAEVVLVSAPV